MARASLVAASPLLLALLLAVAGGAAAAAGEVPLSSWELHGLIGGGGGDDDVFGFSSAAEAASDSGAVVRRVLQSQQYISYGALQRDTTPCSVRGASYYNCRPGAEANPYSRGCSAITRCRS